MRHHGNVCCYPSVYLLLFIPVFGQIGTLHATAILHTRAPSAHIIYIRQGEIPVELPVPLAKDCQKIANILYSNPMAYESRWFGDKSKSWPTPSLTLPILVRDGSCQMQIHTDGRPFHNHARLIDFANNRREPYEYGLWESQYKHGGTEAKVIRRSRWLYIWSS